MVKANFDKAIFTLEHQFGIEVVLRDDQGSVLASLSKLVSKVYNPLEIEALAAAATLRFALDLGFSQVVLEGDSQVLMEALINDYKFLSSEGLHIWMIPRLLLGFLVNYVTLMLIENVIRLSIA